MAYFSVTSKKHLAGCVQPLQDLFYEVIKEFDCTIVTGRRGKEEQNLAWENNFSQLKWPNSKHNFEDPELSQAVDAVPFIASIKKPSYSLRRCYYFAGYVKAIAERMGIEIRCGADWDGDDDPEDQEFHDPTHFEYIGDE